MLGDAEASAVADAEQADYYRRFLDGERSSVVNHISKLVKKLTECMTSGEVHAVSHFRGRVRQAESDLRSIDRMVEALDRRFPNESSLTVELR